MKFTFHIILFMAVLGGISCNMPKASNPTSDGQTQTTTKAIDPPVQLPVTDLESFTINTSVEQKIVTKSGTIIIIPAGSLVDDNGKTVTGEAEITYREFRGLGEIIASGINMQDNENDQVMVSDGMFELRGKQGASVIAIAQGKSILVEMKALDTKNDYQYFELNETTAKWKQYANCPVIPNAMRDAAIEKVKSHMDANGEFGDEHNGYVVGGVPIKPIKYTPSLAVLEMDVDYKEFQELAQFKNVLWNYEETEANKAIVEKEWTDVRLQKNPQGYMIYLTKGKEMAVLDIKPVLKGKDFEKAMAEYEVALTGNAVEQRMVNAASQGDGVRRMNVAQFGLCNIDFLRRIGAIEVDMLADFDEKANNGGPVSQANYICVPKTGNTAWRSGTGQKFLYSKDIKAIFAILPGNKIAVVEPEILEKINFDQVSSDKRVSLSFTTRPNKIESPADIDKLIAELI